MNENNTTMRRGIVEIRKMSRDYFVKNVASWLPRYLHISLNALYMEEHKRCSFWLENDDVCIIRDASGKERMRINFRNWNSEGGSRVR